MNKRILLLLAALAFALPSCTVYVREPGSAAADGSIYFGFHLFRNKGAEQETFDVGDQQGAFSSIRLFAGDQLDVDQVVVIFSDGERWTAPVPRSLGKDQWTNPIPLPRAPRAMHSIVVTARSPARNLAKLEIHGSR